MQTGYIALSIKGKEVLYRKMSDLLYQFCNALVSEVEKDKLLSQFGSTVYEYFNQPMGHALFSSFVTFQNLLGEQLESEFGKYGLTVRAGMIDSKGWLSAIFEFKEYSLTCLLFEESITSGDLKKPLKRKIETGGLVSPFQ